MPLGFHKSKRSERVASLELPPGQWERAWNNLRRRDVLGRIGLALLAAAVICSVIRGWDPPDPRYVFRAGYTPPRDIAATVPFSKPNPQATQVARERARAQARYVYEEDAEPLVQLRAQLRNTLAEVAAADSLEKLDPKIRQDFGFSLDGKKTATKEQEEQYLKFRAAFTPQKNLDRVETAVAEVFAPFEERGLLDKLDQSLGPGNQEEIVVYPKGHPNLRQRVLVSDVLIGDGTVLRDALRRRGEIADVADRLSAWLLPRLKPTLRVDPALTKQNMDQAEADVGEVMTQYSAGQTLAKAGQPLNEEQIDLLGLEYAAAMRLRHSEHIGEMIARRSP